MNPENLDDIISVIEDWNDVVQKNFFKLIQFSSLTQFLRNLPHSFSVELTYLGEKKISLHDKIEKEKVSTYFVREVNLLLDEIEVVRARSSCLPNSLYWRRFLDCGCQPIGEKLFDIQNLSRSELNFGLLSKDNGLVRIYNSANDNDIVFRQSEFTIPNEKLILTECFLPNIKQFL
ncbi:MAG: chorismate lyase [Neisseriaceae bacterium]|nr:chorismate lyase [Neisseriaceae bacterium]